MLKIKRIWKGLDIQSLENCDINCKDDFNVKSTIKGEYNNEMYLAEYVININKNWEALSFCVNTKINGIKTVIEGKKNSDNYWVINDEINEDLNACIDIDISLTPFTNSLPINRLKLAINESSQITVLYVNVFDNKISSVEQLYSRVSETQYSYKNIATNFEALITVDKEGFVTNYPNLFQIVLSGQ